MGKDAQEKYQNKAKKLVNRAKMMVKAEQYKKAGKTFDSAGELLMDLHEFSMAREVYFNAAKAYINNANFSFCLDSLRNAAAAAIFLNDFADANKFFKNAIKYIPNAKGDQDFKYLLYSSLSYLCLFIAGKQDQGLIFLKQIKRKVDSLYFKENPLIKLVKNLTIAIRDKKKEYLDKVEQDFEKYKFRPAEEKLMKEVLLLAKTHISIITELILDKEQYTTNDIINLTLNIDTTPLIAISKYPFHRYDIKELKISNIGITLSDNLLAQKKPDLPINTQPGEKLQMEFEIRPNFQVEKTFIGPILLTCEIDGKFVFFLKTQAIIPDLISPPPSLEISLKNLRTPLIDQTFPMEILVENKSEGVASEIIIEVEFPDQLKLIRGLTKKQIYSLKPNEDIKWEANLKPLEAGDYTIKILTKFKDEDQNQIEIPEEFPFSIKL